MTENINSEALDRLFEIDGQLYGAPSLVRMARIRASILHASAAWGSDDDGTLIGWLADEVERLRKELDAIVDKPDPLVEAIREMALTDANHADADRLCAAIAKRGGKIVWGEG